MGSYKKSLAKRKNIFPENKKGMSKAIQSFFEDSKKDKREFRKENIQKQDEKVKTLIEVRDLKKSFGKGSNFKEVLKGINFDIKEGQHIAILGPNGAGKTVLVETIAGLIKPSSGTIKYLYPFKKSFLEEIGFQFQDSSYPAGLGTKDIIKFVLDVFGSKITIEEFNGLVKIFGINEFYNKKVSKLSGGQQQRLNALLAILHKPKIIFFDEISTGLDVQIRNQIKHFIKEYAKENKQTICIVSHYVDEIEYLADWVAIVDNGKILVLAEKTKIIEEYGSLEKLIEIYI